jgi:hypothetical protein
MTTHIHTSETVQEYSLRQPSATCKAYVRTKVYVVQPRKSWTFLHSPTDTAIYFRSGVWVSADIQDRQRLILYAPWEFACLCDNVKGATFCSVQFRHIFYFHHTALQAIAVRRPSKYEVLCTTVQDNSTLHIFQFIVIGRPNQAVTDNGPVSVKEINIIYSPYWKTQLCNSNSFFSLS